MKFGNWKLEIGNWKAHSAPESGVVALITSIIVGLILIVITLGSIRIMGNELRQATDFDLSVRAYFAAEAGLEDAIAEIRTRLAANTSYESSSCDPYSTTNANLSKDTGDYLTASVAYTCQVVTLNQNELTGSLDKEESIQIDLTGIDFNNFLISWHQEGADTPFNSAADATIPPQFPPGPEWTNYPAILEATVISYPRVTPFTTSNISTKTKIIKPSAVASGPNQGNMEDETNNPVLVDCQPSSAPGTYECQVRLINPPAGSHHILRLQARYAPTHYKIEAFNGTCGEACQVSVPGSQLIIDVTGKAGDVFRRIQAKSLLGGASPLPFVILTDQDICKLIEVGASNTAPEAGC